MGSVANFPDPKTRAGSSSHSDDVVGADKVNGISLAGITCDVVEVFDFFVIPIEVIFALVERVEFREREEIFFIFLVPEIDFVPRNAGP